MHTEKRRRLIMRKSRILTVLLALTVIFTMSFAAIPVYHEFNS